MPITLKIDEDLPREVGELARRAGYEARDVCDQGLGGATDGRLWEIAQAEGRVLLTADKGFADARRYPPGSHAGVVLFRLRRETRARYIRLARVFLAAFHLDDVRGGIAVVTPEAIRIRRPK